MKTTCAWLLLILFGLPVFGFAIGSIQINSVSAITFVNEQDKVTIQCDAVCPGERVDIEFFIDVNNNNLIDARDYKFDMLSLVDGIGWIKDAEAPENDIPGDESTTEGIISTTISITRENRLSGMQNWLLRASDADESVAIASIYWNLADDSPSICGTVTDNFSKSVIPGELVFACDQDYTKVLYTTVTDDSGRYSLCLTPGLWNIYTNNATDTLSVEIIAGRMLQKNLYLNSLASFITGKVRYEDGSPVPGFVITAQNPKLMQFYSTRTDNDGHYVLNVDPGVIEVSCSPTLTNMFGGSVWPEEYYAAPQNRSLNVVKGQESVVDVQLKKYPASLYGNCRVDGKGVPGALIQGAAKSSVDGKIQLFQTWTRKDGSYTLGVSGDKLVSLVAQKTGYSLHPETGYVNIDPADDASPANYDFSLTEDKPLMTISGTLYNDDLSPARDIPVIAYNQWEKSHKGYIIQKTNSRGEFYFHPEVEGSWQIGLYKKDYKSIPPLHYLYVNEGMAYTDIKFYLYMEKDLTRFEEGKFKPTALNILPNQPTPFEPTTTIQFVLPEARRTRIQMLDIAGHPLRTLIDEKLSGGKHAITWDGNDNAGNPLSGGIYVCRIDAVNETMQQTITLLR